MAKKTKIALERAGESLKLLQRALLDPATRIDGIVATVKSIAEDLEYTAYVRWMDCELAGYKGDKRLGDLLGVDEGDGLPARVGSYRMRVGKVTIAHDLKVTELPYNWFFTDSLARLEQSASSNAEGQSIITISISPTRITDPVLRDIVENSSDEKRLPITFNGFVYAQILSGLRSQLVNAASELSSAHKMLVDLLP